MIGRWDPSPCESILPPASGRPRRDRARAGGPGTPAATGDAAGFATVDDECPPMRVRTFLGLLIVVALGTVPRMTRAESPLVRLEVLPARARLAGPEASQRLVVLGIAADGSRADVTPEARFEAGDPEVARVDDRGRIRPAGDGAAEGRGRVGSVEARVTVEVKDAHAPRRVSFRNEVVPALTKLGCNQGACHGSQHGKGGFKLSLLGFEPDPDHTAIVKSAEGRRVTPFAPEESLLLLKPTLAVAHGGGKRMEPDAPEAGLLRLWLEQGAPGPLKEDPSVVGVKVLPDRRLLEPDQAQQLVVVAAMSDGTERDVTDQARYDTLNEAVAKVDAAGLARTVGQGETNIMVRYQGQAAMARLTVPFARDRPF